MPKRFRRPSPALVIASIALFVSLGGVSYGVATGSIDSREIKNNTVRSKDIKNNDVRGGDIRTGTVNGSDVGDNSLTGADISESSLGKVPSANNADRANLAGFATSAGSASRADAASSANTVADGAITASKLGSIVTRNASAPLPDAGNGAAQVSCAAGERMLGGGAAVGAFGADLQVLSSRPADENQGAPVTTWRAAASNAAGGVGATTVIAHAVCLRP